MNTEKFCVEFENIFGRYKSNRIRRCHKVLSGNKRMVSSPYSTFIYEIGLYLNVPVSEVKKLFSEDCQYLFFYVIMFIDDLEKDSEKLVQKLVWLLMLLDKIFTSSFQSTDMFIDKVLRLIFIEAKTSFEFLFYETIMVTFELYLNRRLEKKKYEIIKESTENLL